MPDKCLSKDDILNADDISIESVSVPEWGGHVLVKVLTGTERDAFEGAIYRAKGDGQVISVDNIRARLSVLTIVGEDNNRLFSDSEMASLGRKSSVALDRVFTIAQKINALRAEDVEELAKNLKSDLSADSGSGSQDN